MYILCFTSSNGNVHAFADSPWRTHISQAILKLQEDGKLVELKKRWWYEKNGGVGNCDNDEDEGDSLELGMDNVGGVSFIKFMNFIFIEMLFDLFVLLLFD